jgi:hypothetical protein
MKNILSSFLTLGLLLCGSLAMAAEQDSLTVKEMDKTTFVLRTASNDSLAVKLEYVGSSTEAIVTISSDVMTAYAGGAVDTSFGSAGSYRIAGDPNYNTIGELCDAIDALDDYKCSLLGMKSDDASNKLRQYNATAATNDLKSAGGFEVKFDTAALNEGDQDLVDTVYDLSLGRTPSAGKRLILQSCEVDVNGSTPDLRVYGKLRVWHGAAGKLETDLVDLEQVADDTEQVIDWAIDDSTYGLEFDTDEHVVVRAGNETSTQAAANDLRCWFVEK